MTRILHVPYTYFPDPVGGTEVYVAALCVELARLGFDCEVAAPGSQDARYRHDGVWVNRFATMAAPGIDQAWGAIDRVAEERFAAILGAVEPEIVHLHARTSAVSSGLVDQAKARGVRVVLTYHSPTVSCARGTMLHFGIEPCDGTVTSQRCIRCVLDRLKVPAPVAGLAASTPAIAASRMGWGAARIPWLVSRKSEDFRRLLDSVDHVVAVCDWVRATLLHNGLPPDRLSLCRQGVSAEMPEQPANRAETPGPVLRIAYYGRIDPAKGLDLLVDAVLAAPAVELALDLYLVDPADGREIDRLRARCGHDRRIVIRPPVAPGEVTRSMAAHDLIAVPSTGLETGPLVVLEAQAAGVPVLGSNRGGIAELVRDGIDGVLVPPGDLRGWSDAIAQLAANPDRVRQLRANVRAPRAMREVGADMAALYQGLLAPGPGNPEGVSQPENRSAAGVEALA